MSLWVWVHDLLIFPAGGGQPISLRVKLGKVMGKVRTKNSTHEGWCQTCLSHQMNGSGHIRTWHCGWWLSVLFELIGKNETNKIVIGDGMVE